jgi:hypothetical protein
MEKLMARNGIGVIVLSGVNMVEAIKRPCY